MQQVDGLKSDSKKHDFAPPSPPSLPTHPFKLIKLRIQFICLDLDFSGKKQLVLDEKYASQVVFAIKRDIVLHVHDAIAYSEHDVGLHQPFQPGSPL